VQRAPVISTNRCSYFIDKKHSFDVIIQHDKVQN